MPIVHGMASQVTGSWIPEETFGTRLLLLRHRLGLTQREAASKCDLDDGSWSNWENGTSPRDKTEVARKIHDATGVDLGWLAWGITPPEQGTLKDATGLFVRCSPEKGRVLPFLRKPAVVAGFGTAAPALAASAA